MFFEIRGEITEVETFATGTAIRELPRLPKIHGQGRWRYDTGADLRFRRLDMPSRRTKHRDFVVCIQNAGYEASLEVRKLYPIVPDADAETNNLIRVIDESGEDYVYPAAFFQKLALSTELQRALSLTI